MNRMNLDGHEYTIEKSFRPQQGLTIMNNIREMSIEEIKEDGFRPQQGLTIMNPYLQNPDKH